MLLDSSRFSVEPLRSEAPKPNEQGEYAELPSGLDEFEAWANEPLCWVVVDKEEARTLPTRYESEDDATFAGILADAEAEGYDAGKAAGSWVIDGNTSEESARALLRGIEEGDPMILDELPSAPLSGEWADGPLPRDILEPYELAEDDDAADDVLRSYEQGFDDGVMHQVEREALQAGYLRSVERDGWRIRLYERFERIGETPRDRTYLGYEFGRVGEAPIFAGEDYGASPLHALDSDESVRGILSFLTLRPGDTDAEYFEPYSEAQREFAESEAESVALLFGLYDDEPEPLEFVDDAGESGASLSELSTETLARYAAEAINPRLRSAARLELERRAR